MLGAVGDEDLLGPRGEAPAGEALGDRAPQRRQAEGIVAVVIEPARELAGGRSIEVLEDRGRRKRRDPQVQPVTADDCVRRRTVPLGERDPAAGSLPARQVSLGAQAVVCGRDGGAAQPDRRRQSPLGGQSALEGDLAVEHERPHRRRQPFVARSVAPPVAE